nr:cytochrome-c peroxidase [Myxococcus sp. RHSTA-1-4]
MAVAEGRGSLPDVRASAALGEALFFDTCLSADGTVACATCHRPEAAFADSQPVTPDVYGRAGTRNAPSLIGAGRARELFWDGRRGSLKELVLDPLTTHSLCNVAVTAPCMHDGSVATLAESVERELYYRSSEGLRVGDLTPAERGRPRRAPPRADESGIALGQAGRGLFHPLSLLTAR